MEGTTIIKGVWLERGKMVEENKDYVLRTLELFIGSSILILSIVIVLSAYGVI